MENRLRVILLDDELHALGNLSEGYSSSRF